MIVSTRESQKSRERVLHLGISQISGGSRTSVGGYAAPEPEAENSAQFDVSDTRSLDEVVAWLMEIGYLQFLYSLLSSGSYWRPLYEFMQKRSDTKLLSSKRTDDTQRIFDRLC